MSDFFNRDFVYVLHPVMAVIAFCHGPKGKTVFLRERPSVHLIGKEDLVRERVR